MFKYRTAIKEDKENIKKLYKEFVASSPFVKFNLTDEQLETYSNTFFDNPDKVIVIFYEEDKPIAMVAVESNDTTSFAHVAMIYVSPEYREEGIGDQLVEASEYWAKNIKNKEFLQMSILEGPNYKKISKAYIKQGFKPVDHVHIKEL
jgi:GNAT superfamily N-acetyltransferase